MSIFNSYFEDHNTNRFFWHTGRSNVKGLNYPDIYLALEGSSMYAKVATINYESTATTYINETVIFTLMGMDSSIGSMRKYKTTEVHFEIPIQSGVIDTDNICCVGENKSQDSASFSIDSIVRTYLIKIPSQPVIEVWIKIDRAKSILIQRQFSLSTGSAPENEPHPATGYTITFATHEGFKESTDTSNELPVYGDGDGSDCIIGSTKNKDDMYGYVSPSNYKFAAVSYTALYEDNYPDTEYSIKPINLHIVDFSEHEEDFVQLNGTDCNFSVTEEGVYLLFLKQDFYLTDESADTYVTLKTYKNSSVVSELNAVVYLEQNKRLPFLTGVSMVSLKPTDKITLRATFSNIDDVYIYNQSYMGVLKLCPGDNLPETVVGEKWYDNLVDVARCGRSVLALDPSDLDAVDYGNVNLENTDNLNYVNYIKNGVSLTFDNDQ